MKNPVECSKLSLKTEKKTKIMPHVETVWMYFTLEEHRRVWSILTNWKGVWSGQFEVLDLMSGQQNPSFEARPVRPRVTEFDEGAPETSGLEESCALALSYRVWARKWAMKMVRGDIRSLQRSGECGAPRPGPPPQEVMGVSWIKALGPQKTGPVENLSLLGVAGRAAVRRKTTEA